MRQVIEIDGKLPNMNEIIDASKRHWSLYAKLKKRYSGRLFGKMSKELKPIREPVFIDFEWHRSDRRTDPDNLSAGGRKIILDCLQSAGILANDGWKEILGFSDKFFQSDVDKVVVIFYNMNNDNCEV